MDRNQQMRLLALSAAVALTACGGGGSEPAAPAPGPAPAPAPAPAPGPAPAPAPAPAPTTGLTPPTGTLSVSLSQALNLVSKANEVFNGAAGGYAAVNLGAFNQGIGGTGSSPACPGGGSATYTSGGGSAGTYAYNACVINGISYNGQAAVAFTMSNGALASYEIDQAQVTAVVAGVARALDDRVECTVTGSEAVCVGHYHNNRYGDDFTFVDGKANGSYQCECATAQWNGAFTDMQAATGSGSMAAAVGTATLVRVGPSAWDVTITSGSQSNTFNVR